MESASSDTLASSVRQRWEVASTASQRRHTREQRLRSPEPRRPKTRARSSSGRSAVWSSQAASAMEERTYGGAESAGDGGRSGGLWRRGTEGHWPMGHGAAADLPRKGRRTGRGEGGWGRSGIQDAADATKGFN